MQQRDVLRLVFNNDAARYDLTRPRYPAALFDDLAGHADLTPGARVFEIGCGTGQATLHMASRGWAVRAIDLGDRLATYTAARLRAFPAVSVSQASFDDMVMPEPGFDLVAAFTTFHWLDPDTRVRRAAGLLRPGTWLAIVDTHHVLGDDPFFERSQDCYTRWDPDTKPGFRLPAPDEVVVDTSEVDDCGLFDEVVVRAYEVEILYTTAQYLDLLRTFSDHATMQPEAQSGLFACLSALIEAQGGSVRKDYVFSMVLAQRNDQQIS
ncbi:MAG: class I SAM-dependent methyltransferase [Acidimicrobiia bacterium]|nr:class I SAM-dependent methyltransferase [Acidimicrobiia bacterium]